MEEFKMFDKYGNTNFYIKEAKNLDGEKLNFYNVYMGNKIIGAYKNVKAAKIAVKKMFAQDKNGNGLIPNEEIKFILCYFFFF